MKKIAIIAHDNMKPALVDFVERHLDFFSQENVCSTGTTGLRVQERTGLKIERFLSGPLGGDQQIGAEIATDNMKGIFFFRDPLTAQPHEPDISALIRLADVHKIPIATNEETAELLILAFKLKK